MQVSLGNVITALLKLTQLHFYTFHLYNWRMIAFFDLTDSRDYDVNLFNSRYYDVNLFNSRYYDVNLFNSRYYDVNLFNSGYYDANLFNSRYYDVNLFNSRYYDANLFNSRYYDANLFNSRYYDANLFNSRYYNANLFNSRYYNANLFNSRYYNANLFNSRYYDANLFNSLKIDLPSSFGLFHVNIASLDKHIGDLNETLSLLKYNFDIIGITEHKIRIDMEPSQNIKIPGYDDFIFVRTATDFGGTVFFIKEGLDYIRRVDLDINSLGNYESMFIESVS